MSDCEAFDAASVRTVHLIAISGVAMTSLAGMLSRGSSSPDRIRT
jgi:hypothetical protein